MLTRRYGEVEKINIEDLNWENCSAIVNGKGSKQRENYFTTKCKVWLKKYLASRKDSCKALFVTDTNPVKRMAIPTLRWAIKRLAVRGQSRQTYTLNFVILMHAAIR
ncbi:tyrosine-type recombinase/integrase [Paenibacillus sacheonensis]